MDLGKFMKYIILTWFIGMSVFLMHQNGILIDSMIAYFNATDGVSITLGDILAFITAVMLVIGIIDCVVFDV